MALGLLLVPSRGHAGNDEQLFLGGDAAIASGAVTATGESSSAVYYNPALLAAEHRTQIDGSGNVFMYRFNDSPALLRFASGPPAGVGGLEVNALPGALTFLRRLGPGITGAFGLFVTDAQAYAQNAVLTGMGTPERALRVDTAEVERNWHGTLALGVDVVPGLRFGARIYLDAYNQQSTSTFTASWARSTTERALYLYQQRASLDVIGVGAGVGLHWAPGGGLEVGLSVLSPRLDLAVSYAIKRTELAASVDMTGGDYAFIPFDASGLEFTVASLRPLVARVGLAYRWERGWVALDADFRTPSFDARYDVARRVNANVRAGTIVQLDDTWSVGGGLFTDLAPRVPLSTQEPFGRRRLDYVGGTIGVEMRNRVPVREGQQSDDLVFNTRIGLRYAYGFGEAVGISAADFPVDGVTPATALLVSTTTHEVSLNISSGLAF